MNPWTPKPTEPGLYLYDSERGQRLPVTWDGQNCWIVLPLGTEVYGRRAIMFRPAHGLFWRIPNPPPVPAPEPPLVSGDLGGGSSFEIRKYEPGPPPPMMPLIKVESVPGVLAEYTPDPEAFASHAEIVGRIPFGGRWGWKDIPPPLPASGRCMDALRADQEGASDAT